MEERASQSIIYIAVEIEDLDSTHATLKQPIKLNDIKTGLQVTPQKGKKNLDSLQGHK